MQFKDIIQWLEGPRIYAEGVKLYLLHGQNRRLRYVFTHQADQLAQETLVEQLRIIAGLSEASMRSMRRKAAKGIPQQLKAERVSTHRQAPAEKVQRVKFRDRFPFLSEPDCPDVLKVAVADLFTSYGKYCDGHAALANLPDDEQSEISLRLCAQVVENYLTDRAIMEELKYYADHHELLGTTDAVASFIEKQNIANLTDAELIHQRASASANVSKAKRRLSENDSDVQAAALLERWIQRKTAIEAEISERKKN